MGLNDALLVEKGIIHKWSSSIHHQPEFQFLLNQEGNFSAAFCTIYGSKDNKEVYVVKSIIGVVLGMHMAGVPWSSLVGCIHTQQDEGDA